MILDERLRVEVVGDEVRLLQFSAVVEPPLVLHSISLRPFMRGVTMPGTAVTLTAAGQTAATVLSGTGSDGNPWSGSLPVPAYSDDNAAAATTDAGGVVTAVANGSDNVTASLTTAEGVALTSNAVTVTVEIPPPVVTLAQISLSFQ